MKINSIKISNIFSFKYQEDFDNYESINFYDNQNILIGPNGSGKSNFIEIISQIFKRLIFKEVQFNEQIIKNGTDLKKTLNYKREEKNIGNILPKHRNYTDNDRQILLDISFNKNDISNIKFINENFEKLKELSEKYSNALKMYEGNRDIEDGLNKISIKIYESEESNNFNVDLSSKNDFGKYLKWYIINFNFLKTLIEIHNKYENPENPWPELKNTFALISCYRNYNSFDEKYTLEQDEHESIETVKNNIKNESTKSSNNNEPAVFDLVKRKVSYYYNHLLHSEKLSNLDVEQKIRNNGILKSINDLMYDYLYIRACIKKVDDNTLNFRLYFEDDSNNEVRINELSSGEKGILHFIFSLYGYDLENGMMIIDEPELHLHPQVQKSYLDIMKKVSEDFDIQFIIATHSAFFVNINTIENVFRFYIEEGATKIINPKIDQDDKDLLRILNYANSSKIFFNKKVVFVEGESDEYFCKCFWDFYKESQKTRREEDGSDVKIKDDIEFVNIEGKGKYDEWKKFTNKYGIKTYFIGDWDNVADFNILNEGKVKEYSKEFIEEIYYKKEKEIEKKNSKDRVNLLKNLDNFLDKQTLNNINAVKELRDYMSFRFIPYSKLVGFINDNKQDKYKIIIDDIEKKYKENVYILQEGELEDYLNLQEKGIGKIIDFCKKDFNGWKNDPKNEEKLKELNNIFNLISEI